MSYNNNYKLFIMFSFFFTLIGCKEETSEFTEQIFGRWELKEALRNERQAASLENIFFEFYPDGKMITNFNISGDDQSSDYKVVGNRIRQKKR